MLVYFCALLTLDLQRSRCPIGFWELALPSLINQDGVAVGIFLLHLLSLDVDARRLWERSPSSFNQDDVWVGIFSLLLLSLDGDDTGLSTIVGLPDGGTSSSMSIGSFTCYGCFY